VRTSARSCELTHTPVQVPTRPRAQHACARTICFPSVMVDIREGLNASPENRTRGSRCDRLLI
jgi:hypothetical protein